MSANTRNLRADGEATRSRILEAAGRLVAVGGFADTTSKAIAEQAGVDLASINYHFGSRNGLYQALLVEAHRRMIDVADLRVLARSDRPAEDKLRALIAYLLKRSQSGAEEWHLAVLAAELLAPSPHVQVLFQETVPAKASLVAGILGEITGIPVDDPALARCLVSVAAPCLLLQLGRRGLPGPVQAVLRSPPDVVVEHFHRFAMAGLRAIGEDYAKSG